MFDHFRINTRSRLNNYILYINIKPIFNIGVYHIVISQYLL